ncbi:MAG: universal stress protein [Fimbriimonadaceae bacterium]|nr:universal stress protein [Fimbriimonadaceae bacterium]
MGKHKIFLGYAPGVGKTYHLLDEAQRRHARGQEVVIADVAHYDRPSTQEVQEGLPVIAPIERTIDGVTYRDLDLDAIVARKPDLVITDELARRNAPGARNEKRWQDVQFLLDQGINVLSTLNVYHLESLNDHIHDITGVRIQETVPDHVLHDADEVEIVDLPPTALLNRLRRGDVFAEGHAPAEVIGFYNEATLSALREIALREIAGTVDEEIQDYRREKRIEKPWATQDRVMICVSPTRPSLRLIRRGWRMGQRMHGEVIAVHVKDGSSDSVQAKKILADDFALAQRLGIETVTLEGPLSPTLVAFAKERNVTAIILGHPERSRLQEMFRPSVLTDLSRELRTVDLIVVASETELPSDHA